MLGRTNTGGGGSGVLNFQVIGGTTAPNNPKENTIWVNTSTKITDWVFSATQPTAASGRVWIPTGTFSTAEFNALKKNGIQVYPLSAKQYVSGAWVNKTAKSYQNGKWVEWILSIYDNGKENVELVSFNPAAFAVSLYNAAQKTDGYIHLLNNTGKDTGSGIYFIADLAKYSKFSVEMTLSGSYLLQTRMFVSPINSVGIDNMVAELQFDNTQYSDKTIFSIDIKSLSGEFACAVGSWAPNYDIKIYRMWLE